MKKHIAIILALLININLLNTTFAQNIQTSWISNSFTIYQNKEISKKDMFIFFANYYKSEIPSSYKYINVWFYDVKNWSKLEEALQKLIYLDLIENPNRQLKAEWKISAWWFYRLSEKVFWIKINDKETKKELLNRNTTTNDLLTVRNFLQNDNIKINNIQPLNKKILQKEAILNDVYKTLINQYYGKDNLSKLKLLDWAIEWLAKWTNDKHTVYFPPVKSESFQDALSWEYEWIWSYVDMVEPGVLKITSPIPGSPSEKAWLKWGDIVLKVDWKEISRDNSLLEVVKWIKWPAWTDVILTIKRNWEIKDVTVTRDKIIITDIESKKLNSRTYYIHIKSFWENVSREFKKSLEELKNNRNINKVIIDLRNDWGWYLDQVTEILSYFVPKWEKTAVVKYYNSSKDYISKWYEDINFSKYKIVILQNSWTASASEILIWTLKDYYKNLTIIGEQSYWKGSVQVMKWYSDGSMLKYTIAKWFTWWTETGIDWIWITPDYKLEFDFEKFKKYWTDNQLNKAKTIR
jgi:C-terminal peptidase prc